MTAQLLEVWTGKGCGSAALEHLSSALQAAHKTRGDDDDEGASEVWLDDTILALCVSLVSKKSAALGVRIAALRALARFSEMDDAPPEWSERVVTSGASDACLQVCCDRDEPCSLRHEAARALGNFVCSCAVEASGLYTRCVPALASLLVSADGVDAALATRTALLALANVGDADSDALGALFDCEGALDALVALSAGQPHDTASAVGAEDASSAEWLLCARATPLLHPPPPTPPLPYAHSPPYAHSTLRSAVC